MKETSKLVKLGIESSCIESLIKQNEKIIRKEFDDNINDLKIYIFNENLFEEKVQFSIKELIEKEDDSFPIFEHFDFVNFTRFICSFSAMLAKKLLHKDELKKKSLFDLYNLMKVKANDIRNNFEEIFEKKLGELTSQMAEKLDRLIHDIDSTFNISFLSSKYSINQLKIQAKNNILNNLKPDIEEQVYREVSKILYDIYANNFSNKLMEIFHDLLNGDEPDEKLEKIFFDKGKKIMEIFYNKILKLLDYPNDDYAEKKDEKKEEGKKYKKSTKAKLREIENKAKNNKKRKINKEEEKKENEDEKNKKDEESDEREEESDEDDEEKEKEDPNKNKIDEQNNEIEKQYGLSLINVNSKNNIFGGDTPNIKKIKDGHLFGYFYFYMNKNSWYIKNRNNEDIAKNLNTYELFENLLDKLRSNFNLNNFIVNISPSYSQKIAEFSTFKLFMKLYEYFNNQLVIGNLKQNIQDRKSTRLNSSH